MSALLFILILLFLVLIHELGHFIVAKFFGIRVEEFGFGYPPRATKLFTWRGTLFTLNWLPFGGFVKIFGEDSEEESTNKPDSFAKAPKYAQALVLVAGVFMNLVFAWIVFIGLFMTGTTLSVSNTPEGVTLRDPRLLVLAVQKDSPAEKAGLKAGDTIRSYTGCDGVDYSQNLSVLTFKKAVASCATPDVLTLRKTPKDDFIGSAVFLHVSPQTESLEIRSIFIEPDPILANGAPGIGIGLDLVGEARLPFVHAVSRGSQMVIASTIEIFKGFGSLITGLAAGNKNMLANVSGPIGIVGAVGDAYQFGFAYVLLFAAMISLNLAVINILPFPALDGGRLLFVAVESITGKPVPVKVANTVNIVGFGLLLLLMLVVSVHDIWKLF